MTGQVVERDQMTASEARAAAILLGKRKDWNPDVAMRYLPIVQLLRRRDISEGILEMGSGALGIGPYLRAPFFGIDTCEFQPRNSLLRPVSGSVLQTPLRGRSCRAVISVDMLEHVPSALRRPAIDEMVRITGQTLVIGVPAGDAAMEHDREMARTFRDVRGVDHQFFLEHVEEGLPSIQDLRRDVEVSVASSGRTATIEMFPNANLRVRSFVIRRWIRRGMLDRVAWVVMVWFAKLLARLNREPSYRQIVVVDFSD